MGTLLLVVGLGAAGAHAAALYMQPPDSNRLGEGYFSDAVPGQYYSQKMADDFMLGADGTATGLKWWGNSENYQSPGLSNFASFTIQFWTSDGATPRDPIYSETFLPSATNPIQVGVGFQGAYVYEHTVTLTTPVPLTGSAEYWLSVGATAVDPQLDGYVWHVAIPADGVVATDFFDGAGWVRFSDQDDLAFFVLPEPGTLTLLPLALLALRRR